MEERAGPVHGFYASAFVENLSLKDLAGAYPEARRRAHELFYRVEEGAATGAVFIYPFGAIVFRDLPHLEVLRDGDAVVARTSLGRPGRVLLAGHLDTVPIKDNLPTTVTGIGDQEVLHGRGTVDMKAGVAVLLKLAAELTDPR